MSTAPTLQQSALRPGANLLDLLDKAAARDNLRLGPADTGVYNVRHYGAKGDGTTDDTAAINLAVAALNAAGGGTLLFPGPRRTYLSTGDHTFTVAAEVAGQGTGYWHSQAAVQQYYNGSQFNTSIHCTSATANLFTFNAGYGGLRSLILHNVSATRPTGGSAAEFYGPNEAARVVCNDVVTLGFYIGINHRVGAFSYLNNIIAGDFVKYGIKMANERNHDWGDCVLANIFMLGGDATASPNGVPADAGIRWESGGGLRCSNIKFVDSGILHGFWLEPQNGVTTSQVTITNASCDQISGNAVRITTAGTGSLNYINIGNLFVEPNSSSFAPIYVGPSTAGAVGPVLLSDSILIDESSLTHNWAIEVPAGSGVTVVAKGIVAGGHADTLFNPLGYTGNTLVDLGCTSGANGNVSIAGGFVSSNAIGGWFGLWAGQATPGGSDFGFLQRADRAISIINATSLLDHRISNVSRLQIDANYITCNQAFLPPALNTGTSPSGNGILGVDGSGNLVFSKGGVWKTVTLS